jgi:hypothetical protein
LGTERGEIRKKGWGLALAVAVAISFSSVLHELEERMKGMDEKAVAGTGSQAVSVNE